MNRVQNRSRSGNYDSDSVITQENVPNRNFYGNIDPSKQMITDREYFGLRLAFMAHLAQRTLEPSLR